LSKSAVFENIKRATFQKAPFLTSQVQSIGDEIIRPRDRATQRQIKREKICRTVRRRAEVRIKSRAITNLYLVGTIDRWNDAKQEEEKERVKHDTEKSVGYSFTW